MRRLRIGDRHVDVGEIGVGCAQLRHGGAHWTPLIRRAFDRGANVFDTSEMYGASEEVLGEALAGIPRDLYVLATKVMEPFTAEHVRSAVRASCRRLRTDHVDLYMLHNPPAVSDEVWEALEALARQGMIGAYGSSLDLSQEALAHLARSPRPVLEMLLNPFHQEARGALLQHCSTHDVPVLVKMPLAGGIFSDRIGPDWPPVDDWRRRRWGKTFAERLDRLERVRPILCAKGRTLTQGALAWLLTLSAQLIPIPGIVPSAERLEHGLDAAGMRLTPAEMAALDALGLPLLRDPW